MILFTYSGRFVFKAEIWNLKKSTVFLHHFTLVAIQCTIQSLAFPKFTTKALLWWQGWKYWRKTYWFDESWFLHETPKCVVQLKVSDDRKKKVTCRGQTSWSPNSTDVSFWYIWSIYLLMSYDKDKRNRRAICSGIPYLMFVMDATVMWRILRLKTKIVKKNGKIWTYKWRKIAKIYYIKLFCPSIGPYILCWTLQTQKILDKL